MVKIVVTLFLVLSFSLNNQGQSVPEHITNKPLYDFLDELANDHIIRLTSVAKPYTRTLIAEKLAEAASQSHRLGKRQQAVLKMYLNDFALELDTDTRSRLALMRRDTTFLWSLWPPTLIYQDNFFRFNLKPVYGIRYFINDSQTIRHTWGGIGVHATMGKNWAIWASLRDNQQVGAMLAKPGYLTQKQGGNYKGLTGGVSGGGEFSEMRAGIAWSWKWGTLSFEKDHLEWGDNYNGSNIFSGRVPSYAMIKLNMKPVSWLNFHYHHGWLVSQVVDSLLSYYPQPGHPLKTVYRNKFLAANIFTITPTKRLDISLGNSIIYSEMNVQPIYLVPFVFFKSLVHTQTYGVPGHNHNSALFINISSRQIKHLHLYGSFFVDEFSKTRVGDPERTNFTGTKGGMRLSNWPLRNIALTAEYTFTYPKTYQHRTPATTFETNNFSLGHYLRDNSRELYLAMQINPIRAFTLDISYLKAEKGNLRAYEYAPGPFTGDMDPFMDEIVWSNNTLAVKARYLFANNFSVFAEFIDSDIRGYDIDNIPAKTYLNMFTPQPFHGQNFTAVLGLQLGF
jgi:hypothetical protein